MGKREDLEQRLKSNIAKKLWDAKLKKTTIILVIASAICGILFSLIAPNPIFGYITAVVIVIPACIIILRKAGKVPNELIMQLFPQAIADEIKNNLAKHEKIIKNRELERLSLIELDNEKLNLQILQEHPQ